MTGRLFIFGLGYCGLEIAKLARAAGWRVAGTCRTSDKADELNQRGFEAHLFDGTAALPAAAFGEATHVLCTIAPGTTGDPALKTSAGVLREARWLGYLSTTGVYGDHGGGWVDEDTPARPAQPRSVERLATERAWQAMGMEAGSAVDIFRLPGIYGPGRSAIDQVKAGTARRIDKPGQVFSRIHVEDIAGTVLLALGHGQRRHHLQCRRRPAGRDRRGRGLRLRAFGQARAAGRAVGRGGADHERHGALLLCREPASAERQDQERAGRGAALSDVQGRAARHSCSSGPRASRATR